MLWSRKDKGRRLDVEIGGPVAADRQPADGEAAIAGVGDGHICAQTSRRPAEDQWILVLFGVLRRRSCKVPVLCGVRWSCRAA